MAQASFVTESALLVDPLGTRIEVVDAKAHPVQTAGAQRIVDDQPSDFGSIALTEDLGSGESDSTVGRLVVEVDLVEDCLTQKRAVLGPDDSPVRPVVVLCPGGEPRLDLGSVESHTGASEPVDVGLRQCDEIVLENGQRQWF